MTSTSHHTILKSWLTAANEARCHFPIQNLPYGIFSTGENPVPRVGVAIGDQVLDLSVLAAAGLFGPQEAAAFNAPSLNAFIALGKPVWQQTRCRLQELLAAHNPVFRDDTALRSRALIAMSSAHMHLPVNIGGYTDFYSSKEHATNVGKMFRDPENALLPNWLEVPIGYNGRASSVVVSGTEIKRPVGQIKPLDRARPVFAPTSKLDFELEMAFVIGKESVLGSRIPIDQAEEHIFGMVVMNDWSARDIQQWEYVPLGPFNSKTFATSISPWIVTLEALEPFRVASPIQAPLPLPYLQQSGKRSYDIGLEVNLLPEGSARTFPICRTNFRHMYWTMVQQLAHHTVSGCNVRIGDLMGSGTISGSTEDAYGSLLELTFNGKKPLQLDEGGERSFLKDGDTVIMTGACQGDGYVVGFGEVRGKIIPATLD